MTLGITPFLAGIVLAGAAPTAEVSILAGGRTAPESALNLVLGGEADEGFEPAGLSVILVDVEQNWPSGLWLGGNLGTWGYFPEQEVSTFDVGTRLGFGQDFGPAFRYDLAGRLDLERVPWLRAASNDRAELLSAFTLFNGFHGIELSGVGLARRFPDASQLNFYTTELGLGYWREPLSGPFRMSFGGALQANWGEGEEFELSEARGFQGRLRGEVGLGLEHWDLSLGYRLYRAVGGEPDDDAYSLFTAIGDYTDDADALSGGGFIQHRVDIAAAWSHDPWRLRASALGRYRDPLANGGSYHQYSRTTHANLELRRAVASTWDLLGAIGISSVVLVNQTGYTDVYGWLGVSWKN